MKQQVCAAQCWYPHTAAAILTQHEAAQRLATQTASGCKLLRQAVCLGKDPMAVLCLSPATGTMQVMDRSQLPALTSTTMLVQAALSTPISARAKQSVKARNTVLVVGILTMVGANAAFALIPAVWGALASSQFSTCLSDMAAFHVDHERADPPQQVQSSRH